MPNSDLAQRPGARDQSGSKKLLFGCTLVVLFLAMLFGMEAAVRGVLWKRYRATGPNTLMLRDQYVAWRNNPAYRREDIRHNLQGFRRSVDTPREKPPGTVRIFLLGGSTAWGAGSGFSQFDRKHARLDNDQTIDAWLERKFNVNFPEKRWEVINAASSGYRIHQQLALIESVIVGYQPDQLILLDGYNDVIQLFQAATQDRLDTFNRYAIDPDFQLLANPKSLASLWFFTHSWLRANSSLMRLAEDRGMTLVNSPWRGKETSKRPQAFTEPVQYSDLDPKARQQADAALRKSDYYAHTAQQIRAVSNLEGIRPVFLLQPILALSHKPFTEIEKKMRAYDVAPGGPQYVYVLRELYRKISGEMAAAAEKDGFRFEDMETLYDRWPEQAFSDFAHLTPEGNRAIAEEVFKRFGQSFADQAGVRAGTRTAVP